MNKRRKMKYKIRSILFICSFFYFLLWLSCTTTINDQKYTIKKGKFIATLNETGELDAVNSRIIIIPFIGWKYGWNMKIVGLIDHGAQVSAEDSIAQIDKNIVLKFLVEQQNKLEIEQANLRKLYAQHKSNINVRKTELVSSEAVLNLFKIQLEKYKFESEKKRKIKELEYKRQLVKYNKVEKNYKLTQNVFENELKIQQIKIFQLKNDVKDAKQALKQLMIRSPLNGMMQLLENRRTNQIVKVGDELYQGQKFACVPDLDKMKVKSTVNETDIGKIYLNQKVIIRLDAFPSIPFEGEIIEIGRLSYKKDEKSQTKIFDVVINLHKSDPILKPGMTVRCEIFTAQLDDVFYVENECIIKENMKYYMFIEKNGNYEKYEVKIGPRNNQFTVVYGEYKKGKSVLPLNEIEDNKLTKSGI